MNQRIHRRLDSIMTMVERSETNTDGIIDLRSGKEYWDPKVFMREKNRHPRLKSEIYTFWWCA